MKFFQRKTPPNGPEQERLAKEMLGRLPVVEAPDAIWSAIEKSLDEQAPVRTGLVWAFAVVAAVAIVAVVYSTIRRSAPGVQWEVARLTGSPTVNEKHIQAEGRVGAGQWIETDAASSATVTVGKIGSVEVEPNTRLRVVTLKEGEHRMALDRGEIHAKISAPPKLFFVDTSAGTAIDLGCEYSLTASEDGSGYLSVIRGWVSFQTNNIESLVPAGASCRIRKPGGPGIPYFDDTSAEFKEAVENFGLTKMASEGLDVILSSARKRDTLTLWHLLSRVSDEERVRVVDRMITLTPLPSFLSRESVVKGDPNTLLRWRDELMWTW